MIKLIPYVEGGEPLYLAAALISGIQSGGGMMTIVWAGGARHEVRHTPRQVMDAMAKVLHLDDNSLFAKVFGPR